MDFLQRDVRFAARSLFRTRGFLALVVGAIALGIGANTTVFSVLNTLVLKPLPFEHSERLVMLDERAPQSGNADWMTTSFLDFLDWRAQARSFEGMAAFYDAAFNLSGDGEAERTSGAGVSENLFQVLRTKPILGRGFTAEEGRPGGPAVAVLGHSLWTRRYGADARVLGRTMLIDGAPYTIVGVMPEGFRFPEYADLWVPLRLDPAQSRRDRRFLAVVGRLAPGATLERAQAEIATVNWRLSEEHQDTNEGVTASARPLQEAMRGDTSQAALLFQGITLLVLLIAWANVANLLLARSVGRRKEIAVRGALGATRARIVRQLVAEGLVLGTLGGGAGLALGIWGRNLLARAIPIDLPFWVSFSLDWRVVAFVVTISLVGVLFFALAPAVQLREADLQESLKSGGTRGGTDQRGGRVQGGLVVAETALALVLLISAAMLTRSLLRLQSMDAGFEPAGVATGRISLSASRYPKPEQQVALWARLAERVRTLPGVEAAAVTGALPLSRGSHGSAIAIEGRPPAEDGNEPFALSGTVSPDYFRLMRIPVRAGRGVDASDRADGLPAAVVNEAMAKRFWPGESAVGRRVRFGNTGPWRTVVGVVADVKDSRLANPTLPTVYVPLAQSALSFGYVVVRTAGDPAAVIPGVRAELRGIDPSLAMDQTFTLPEVVLRSMWLSRLYAWLAGVFAVIALGLSAVGTYGLLGYMVRQRTQEIGVRAALGARPRDLVALFVRRGARLAAIAILIGLPVSAALVRLLSSLLYGVGVGDLVVFVAVPVVMMGVALFASFAPAWAAARVEPSIALRHD
jgi:putative ABC transport system permease protein